jgi:hypothetical protein
MWNTTVSLRSLSALSQAAIVLLIVVPYLYYRRMQKQRVSVSLDLHGWDTDIWQADALFAEKHHCLRAKPLPIKWPLGLDMLWTAFEHARANRILRYFVEIVTRCAPTFEQNLLGDRSFGTVEPRNIEAVLSTQFSSRRSFSF